LRHYSRVTIQGIIAIRLIEPGVAIRFGSEPEHQWLLLLWFPWCDYWFDRSLPSRYTWSCWT
jgi:hypothetical protein